MAEKHIANAEASWSAVCVTPDLCKVGKKVIPFDSFRDLSHDMVASPDVNARGTPVYRISDWVEGTDSNAGKGIVSGTSGAPGHVQMLSDGTTVRVNGLVCARHETVVLMNYGAGPNTVGRLLTDQGAPLGVVENGKLPCNDPPKTSDRLERLEDIKQKLAFMDPDQLDEWVRFGDTQEILDELISGIDVETGGEYGWAEGAARWAGDKAAQGTRAVVGFGKDVVLGLGQLLYGAAKVAHPAGLIHTTLDAQILAEQIKLGNICLESLKQAAAATGKELAKPVVDAWERGDHVEAVTRAGLEIGTLVVAIGQVAKAATATRAGKAGATAAGAADDVGKAGGGGGVVDDAAKASAETKAVDAPGTNGVKINDIPPHVRYTESGPLYRGDGRPPEELFNKGFDARGTDRDLARYQLENNDSIYISTSKSMGVAEDFAKMQGPGGYVYEINPRGLQGVDVNATLGRESILAHEVEIAILGRIPPENVISARKIMPNGSLGDIILNPRYGE